MVISLFLQCLHSARSIISPFLLLFTILIYGNPVPEEKNIVRLDNEPPTITCPSGSPFSRSMSSGHCYYVVQGTEFDPSYSDDYPGATLTNDFNHSNSLASAQLPGGSTIITWTVTDIFGLTAFCSITVNIADNQVPTITCPSNITTNNTPGSCSAPVTVPNPIMNDNCAVTCLTWTMTGATTASSPLTGINYVGTYTFNVGTTVVTYTVKDAAGNTASCNFTVKINDIQNPTITCPAGSPFNRGTVSSGCYYIVEGAEFNPTFSDNCPGTTIFNNFNYTNTLANAHLPVGVNVITWTATDASGHIVSCIITVNVIDDDPPVITCPQDITVPCPSSIPEPDITLVTATDNCGLVTVTHIYDNYIGLGIVPGFCPTSVERTYRATDSTGNYTNCIQIITVADQCGCPICQTAVPHYYVNLTGDCDSIWNSPPVSRLGKCCDATGSDRCISFSVLLNEHAVGIYVMIDGAAPPGHYYQVDCGPPTPLGEMLCIPQDGEYHTITICKPGSNANVYTIHSVCGIITPETISTRTDCGGDITISGVVESSVTWNDITGGGLYNRYLSCTSACLSTTVTPDSLAPPVIQYLVCGTVTGNPCSPGGIVCDTVTVHVYPEVSVSIYPDPPVFCVYDPHTIYAAVTPVGTYDIRWWDGPNGTGNIVSTSYEYTPSGPGFYSITVINYSSSLPCSYDTINFQISLGICILACPEQYLCEEADIVGYSTVSQFLTAGGQIDFPCTVPDGNIILLNEVADNNHCPHLITRTYQLWDICGNTDVCDEIITINDTIPPVFTVVPDSVHRCVQDIVQAIWDGAGDFNPIRPDWSTFHAGDVSLDLDPSTFFDNCVTPGNLILHWRITLVGGGVINGTGQVSLYPNDILFPLGNNAIIYWLEDQCGNLTPAGSRPVVIVKVFPRPTITRDF